MSKNKQKNLVPELKQEMAYAPADKATITKAFFKGRKINMKITG